MPFGSASIEMQAGRPAQKQSFVDRHAGGMSDCSH
jgi:hypothetical protein